MQTVAEKYGVNKRKQLHLPHLESTRSIVGEGLHFDGGLFLLPSSTCPLFHHLVCTANPISLHPSYLYVHVFSFSSSSAKQTQTNYVFLRFQFYFYASFFFPTTSQTSLITSSVSFSPPLFLSPLPPSCLSTSASIEGPSVPIHHALHFSLLAGINHKYFIIHHGRLSPAHRQFITAALSAGLPQRL